MRKQVNFGIVGIGGYSKTHIDTIFKISETDPDVNLKAAVVRNKAKYPEESSKLEQSGVKLVPTLTDLLATPGIDVISIPTGMDTHVPYTMQALDAGFPVIMEKPLAGSIDDALILIEHQKKSGLPVFVGYQRMYEPFIHELKRELIKGVIGEIREVRCRVAWPRNKAYYNRNAWAGELKLNDTWVLDCPFNNACAHYLMESLFFAGKTETEAATPVRMRSELYRANPIASADTGVLDIETNNNVRVMFFASHATEQLANPEARIIGSSGEIVFTLDSYTVHGKDKQPGTISNKNKTGTTGPFVAAAKFARNEKPDIICDLETASKQTIAANGAFMSAAIKSVPQEQISCEEKSGDDRTKTERIFVKGLFEAIERGYSEGRMICELQTFDWAAAGKQVELADIKHFPGPLA